MPSSFNTYDARKMLSAEKRVLHTTSWPASDTSASISCAIGTLETATGVQNTATKVAKCAPLKAPMR